jgi:hypothetical protein
MKPRPATAPGERVEYIRRLYDRAIDWYKVAEAKAQFLLTVNGAVAAVALGFLLGGTNRNVDVRRLVGPETWVLLAVAVLALGAAVALAASSLLSRHMRHNRDDLAYLDVDPDRPATYRPEALWYYGHLATMQVEPALAVLRRTSRKTEIDALTFNVLGLSRVVLRKHRLVNAAWTCMAVAILATLATAVSVFVRLAL